MLAKYSDQWSMTQAQFEFSGVRGHDKELKRMKNNNSCELVT